MRPPGTGCRTGASAAWGGPVDKAARIIQRKRWAVGGQRRSNPAEHSAHAKAACAFRCMPQAKPLFRARISKASRRVGFLDHAASQAFLFPVENDILARRHGALGRGETNLAGRLVQHAQLTMLVFLAI